MKCQSCGRQSETKYCRDCTNEKGDLKSFEEIVDNLSKYFVETQGFDPEAAKSAAIGVMSRQPAWEQRIENEQRVKASRMKFIFILTAFVVAVSSGGLVYWVTSPKKTNSLVTYENISKKTASPFDEIIEKEVNGLQVFEMRCPGDQKIYHLSDNILTFESLEGTKNSKNYALYNINLKTMQGFPFIPESMQTRNMMMDSDLRVINQDASEKTSRCWVYKPDDGKMFPIKDFLLGYNSMYYTYRDYINSRDYAVEIETGRKILLPFRQRASQLSKSTIFYDYTNILFVSDKNYHLFDLLTGRTTDMPVGGPLEVIGGSDKFKLMGDETSWYSETADKSLYVLNIPAQKLVKIDSDFIGTPILSNESGDLDEVTIFYQRQNHETRAITTYKKSLFRPEEPPSVVDQNGMTIYPIHATKTNLVYSTRMNFSSADNGKQVDKETALTDLWVRDLARDKDYQLESGGVKSVIVSESYITWVKWQGADSDQYFNICCCQTLPQKIDGNQYNLVNNPPYENIVKTQHGNLEVSEMMCEGSQSFFGAQNLLYGAGYEGYELVKDRDTGSFIKNKSDVIAIFKYEATNRGHATQYLFDLGTESGVKLDRNDTKLKRFLDDHEMSLKWQDYDSLINNMSMNMYDYSDGTFSIVGPNTIPKAMSLKAVSEGNETVIIFNDTKTDHELMTVDCPIEKVFIAPPYDNNMIFTVKLYTEKYVHKYDYYYLDTINAKAIALGKNINILDSNNRYVLIKPDVMEMSYLKLFDKQTGQLADIKPNLKPVMGDLGNCKINDATDPKDLMFVWPYPEQSSSEMIYKIAYARLSEIEIKPTIAKATEKMDSAYFVWVCGNWIFFTKTALSVITAPTILYGLNTDTGEVVDIDEHFTGTINRVGNTLCWITDRGYSGHQFTNICYANIK